MSTAIASQVAELGIEFTPVCVDPGQPYLPGITEGKPSKHICTLSRNGKAVSVEYSMGCAHRVYPSETNRRKLIPVPQFYGGSYSYVLCKRILATSTPKRPELADVLYSLSMDSSACDESFEDWCSNYGYNTDSLKALETYLACQASGTKLTTLGLSRSKLAEMFQDY